jgi:DNA primase large subunit
MSQFNQSAIKDAEKIFNEVKYEGKQRDEVKGVAKLLSQYIAVSELALRGFITMAIRDYQEVNKTKIGSIDTMPKSERTVVVKDLFGRVKLKLEKLLNKPEEKSKVDSAIDTAYKFWEANYNK